MASDDLGDLDGECEACGTALRYTFEVVHEHWGSMTVGTHCCDRMTGYSIGSTLYDLAKKRADRIDRFRNGWAVDAVTGELRRRWNGAKIEVLPRGNGFGIRINGDWGTIRFKRTEEAVAHLVTYIDRLSSRTKRRPEA